MPKVMKALDDAIDKIVPDPMDLLNNKLTRGIAAAPKTLYKGTQNAIRFTPKEKPLPPLPTVHLPPDHMYKVATPSPRRPLALPPVSVPHTSNSPRASRNLLGPLNFGFGTLTLEEHPMLTMPRLVLRGVSKPIDDEGLARLLRTAEEVLERDQPFTILYDIRTCSLPSRKQIGMGTEWGKVNNKRLNRTLQGIAILMTNPITRTTVNMILTLCRPQQPCGIFGDDKSALHFARDKCKEAFIWSKKKGNMKRQLGPVSSPPLVKRPTIEDLDRHNRESTPPRGAPSLAKTDSATSGTSTASRNSGAALSPNALRVYQATQRSAIVVAGAPRVRVQMGELHKSTANGEDVSGRTLMKRLASKGNLEANQHQGVAMNQKQAAAAAQTVAMPSASGCSMILARLSGCGLICGRSHTVDEPASPVPSAPPLRAQAVAR